MDSPSIPTSPLANPQEALDRAGATLRSVFPAEWHQPSVLGLERWQWVTIPLLLAVVGVLTLALARFTRFVLARLARRTATEGDDRIVARLGGPLRVFWAALLGRLALPLLGLSDGAEGALQRFLKALLAIAFFWGLLAAVTGWAESFATSAFAQARPGSRALVNLVSRVARFALLALALLATLSEFGYPVSSVLAGLGLGGLALALGAQKTLEHLFGAFAIAVDQPFREGDFVKVEDFVGTVESIGLRSTRIRTLDRTLVTIPNGKLADMRLETYAVRDRIRLYTIVNLVYGTTEAQLQAALKGFEATLRAHPKLWPDALTVRFCALGPSSLDVEVMAWFTTSDFDEFKKIREDVLLGFVRVVEQAGTSFAFPTQTVHLVANGPRVA